MSLDTLFKLDPTSAASNSNFAGANIAENCLPSGINNALRSLGQMVAQQLCYQSAAISSSVSTNIATASTGLLIPISGANAINSLGTVPGEQASAAVVRFLQFSSSASLSNGASLRLIGNASRKTQPGDIGGYIHVGSADVWHEFLYSRADGALAQDSISVTTITGRSMSTSAVSTVTLSAASASITALAFTSIQATSVSSSVGAFGILKYSGVQVSDLYIQATSTSSATSASTSSNIPYDTSIPQNNEGANLFSLSITPLNASSIIEIEGVVHASHGSTGVDIQVALFLDNAANAIATFSTGTLAGNITPVKIYHEHTASTTSAHTYAIRYGGHSGSMLVNHTSGGNLGGTLRSWLRIRERL